MEASMAASSRGAIMTPYSSPRSKTLAGMANHRPNLRQISLQSAFCDRSHMQYYQVKAFCGGKKDKLEKQKLKGLEALYDGSLSEKRRIKLLEMVSKDLSALSTTFVDGGDAQKSIAEEVRGQIFSDALQVLMAQLDQAKAQRKQRKQEKKAQKKALKAQKKLQCKIQDDETWSSESSNSECELPNKVQILDSKIESPPKIADIELSNSEANGLSREFAETANRLGLSGVEAMEGLKSVQVCMGGKCKNSGSEQLLAAFEESIRKGERDCRVEVVGCKCMGKCRSAPNVKVESEDGRELHMAVEIGSVEGILDRHFRLQEEQDEMAGGSLVAL